MKKLKLNLAQLNNAQVLTRSQMRDVLGGMAQEPSCFAHNADWSIQQSYSTESAAHAAADSLAESTGDHYYYCCGDGCGSGGTPLTPVIV